MGRLTLNILLSFAQFEREIISERTRDKIAAARRRGKWMGGNGRTGGGIVKNKYGALLKGLLRCVPCVCAMIHSTSSKGPKRYRYYVCVKAQKRGWYTCKSKSVPAGELERFVIDPFFACLGGGACP